MNQMLGRAAAAITAMAVSVSAWSLELAGDMPATAAWSTSAACISSPTAT